MPKVKGMVFKHKRNEAQPPLPPQRVTMPRKQRDRGYGDTVHPVTHYQIIPEFLDQYMQPNPWAMDENDTALLMSYRRDMRACDERACLCMCHCHGGPDCYKEEFTDEEVHRFHFRTPNPDHKRAHRECPKGDSHKW